MRWCRLFVFCCIPFVCFTLCLCVACSDKSSDTATVGESASALSDSDSLPGSARGNHIQSSGTESILDIQLNKAFEKDAGRITLHNTCPAENHLGGFEVIMNAEAGYTAVEGSVANGLNPTLLKEQVLNDQYCQLLKKRRLICDPACPSGQTCGLDETCEAMPTGQDMGAVAIQGLSQTVIMSPVQPGNSYFFTQLPHPGFEAGKVIRLSTANGYMGNIELFGVGVTPLTTFEHKWVMEEGTPLELSWPAFNKITSNVEVSVSLSIDQHGLSPVSLECVFPDTGQATISNTFIDALIHAGVSGFPSGSITRRTVDSVTTNKGCVDFKVTSFLKVNIEVSGHAPCARNSDCPNEFTCNLENGKCE